MPADPPAASVPASSVSPIDEIVRGGARRTPPLTGFLGTDAGLPAATRSLG